MKKFNCLILAIFSFQFLIAQVFTTSYPSFRESKNGLFGKTENLKTFILPEFDSLEMKKELNSNKDRPLRFAKVRFVNLSLENGEWEELGGDTAVWRLQIVSKNATTNCFFNSR